MAFTITGVWLLRSVFKINFQTLLEVREDIQNRCYGLCTASTSITGLCAHREIARPHGGTCMPLGLKASVANQ